MRKIVLFLIVTFITISCKEASADSNYGYDMATSKYEEVAVEETVSMDFSEPQQSNTNIEQKIIKNGNLRFETSDLDKTATQVYDAVKKYNAQIQNDSEGKDYRSLYRSITVRVPSKDFEGLVQDISSGVSYFDTKDISSEDVTEQYVDIQARLKAKKELEERYLELLKKAQKVSEILEIEKELSTIREDIEAMQGRLNYLQSRVSMSTIHIYFYKRTADTGITVSYGSKMWNAIKGGFEGISAFFLGLLHIWPFVIISIVAFYYIRKRIKRKNNKQ